MKYRKIREKIFYFTIFINTVLPLKRNKYLITILLITNNIGAKYH